MKAKKEESSEQLSSFYKLLNRVFLLAFIIIASMTVTLCYFIYQDEKDQAITSYRERTKNISVSLSQLAEDYFKKLKNSQKHWLLEHEFKDINDLGKKEINHIYAIIKSDKAKAVSIISPDMKLAYTFPDTKNIGADLSGQEHNRKMLEQKVFTISSPFLAVQGYYAVSVATPIIKNGKYLGALGYLINFDELISSYLRLVDSKEYEHLFIFDDNYSIIYNTRSISGKKRRKPLNEKYMRIVKEKFFGSHVFTMQKPDGTTENNIISFSAININEKEKWYICVEAPLKKIISESTGFSKIYVLPLLLFLLIFILMAVLRWLFAGKYTSILEQNLKSEKEFMQEAEFRLSTILNCLPYIIFETDNKGNFTFLRAALNRIQGVLPDKLLGHNIKDYVTDESNEAFRRAFTYLVKSGKQLHSLRINMKINPEKSANIYSISAFPKNDENGAIEGVIGILHDISERVELEQNLIQSQKMEVVGSVTNSVAHDFNNYLATMLGCVGLIKMKSNNDDEDIQLLENAIKKATDLTQELLTFSRKSENVSGKSDLNECIRENVSIIKKSLDTTISITLDLDKNLPLVNLNKSKLDQILLNLMVNAKEAMPDGGEINLRTWSAELNTIYAPMMKLVPGEYIILKITDTGSGLDEEAKNRIFEPYFTTKSNGTGLGLATIYAIMQNAGGTILVRSNIGKGTEFVIYIPKAPDQEKKILNNPDNIDMQCMNLKGKTILLVEDEDDLSDVITKALKNYTGNIIRKRNAEEGLNEFISIDKKIGLIISDISMENMNGLEMVKQIRKMKYGENVPVLFITGAPLNEKMAETIEKIDATLLKKPFSVTQLLNELEICR